MARDPAAGKRRTDPDHKARFSYGVTPRCSCGWTGATFFGKGSRSEAAAEWRGHVEKCGTPATRRAMLPDVADTIERTWDQLTEHQRTAILRRHLPGWRKASLPSTEAEAQRWLWYVRADKPDSLMDMRARPRPKQ